MTTYEPGALVRVRYGDVDQIGMVRPRRANPALLEVAYVSGGYDVVESLVKRPGGRATIDVLYQPEPPKPPEPTGLGAVVESTDGRQWTRYDTKGDPQPWWCDDQGPDVPIERRYAYADIDVVRVLSDGVTS